MLPSRAIVLALALVATLPIAATARRSPGFHSFAMPRLPHLGLPPTSTLLPSFTSPLVPRDSSGHIARSRSARDAFERSHPCPATGRAYGSCPGYVVDHVIPLKRGGPDAPSNMQWQTKDAAKAK